MIGAISAASDIWQAFRQGAPDPSSPTPTPSASNPVTSTGPSPPSTVTDAAAKLITDVKSFLLGLQSGSAPAGTAAGQTTAGGTDAPTTPTDPAAAAQATLANVPVKPGHGHHHHHRPEANDAGGASLTAPGTALASADPGASPVTPAATTLRDSIARAIDAYTATTAASRNAA